MFLDFIRQIISPSGGKNSRRGYISVNPENKHKKRSAEPNKAVSVKAAAENSRAVSEAPAAANVSEKPAVQKTSAASAEQEVQKPAEKNAEEPAEIPAEIPAENPAEERSEETPEELSGGTEKTSEEPSDEPSEEPGKTSEEEPSEEVSSEEALSEEEPEEESAEESEDESSEAAEEQDRPIFENRELSWLKFNDRVLEEAQKADVPLCERMTFLSIFQTNLDEFFMVRVGSLQDQRLLPGDNRDNKTHMTPKAQIKAITRAVNRLNAVKDDTYQAVMNEAEAQGIRIVGFQQMSRDEAKTLENYFMNNIVPFLSVMIVGSRQPFPFLKNLEIYALAILPGQKGNDKIGLIPCSGSVFPRLINVPGQEHTYVLSEELILHFMPKVYPGYHIREKSLIRITRNADIDVSQTYDEDLNYRDQMSELIKQRQKLAPVRLEMTRDIPDRMVKKLCTCCGLKTSQAFASQAPLDMSFLFQLEDLLRRDPKNVYPRRAPQKSPQIDDMKPMIPQVLDHDILLHYPYESIDPFLRMLQEAARDPQVISIRMTLYRLARNSKVAGALVNAAENGKQVDVLVELKARFDESNNIEWSRQLEDAGCHVIYGIDGLKVHSKLCQITCRDKNGGIRYITQIGTGNYNEKTARLYTDLSLMTADMGIAQDASKVFQAILLGKTVADMKHLLVAPQCLLTPVLQMIDDEIARAQAGEPAYIGLKINSLTDRSIMEKLAEASRAGVRIEMVIRGINCLRSGIPGETENITVKSVVGRFLEHSRIYIFGTPDRDRIYISSADFMTRNTMRRVEAAVPIYDERLKERIRGILNTLLKDNVQGRIQKSDGNYRTDANGEAPLNAQETFLDQAYKAAGTAAGKSGE